MTTTSLIPAVTDYLVSACQASASLGAADPPVLVLDGPQPNAVWSQQPLVLWIGADPANLGEAAAESVQVFGTAFDKGHNRDEDGVITCAARHWGGGDGSTDIKVHRDAAAAIVAAVELLLRGVGGAGDPGDAFMGGLVNWSQVTGPYQWFPKQVPNGAECLVIFRVSYFARLTTS